MKSKKIAKTSRKKLGLASPDLDSLLSLVHASVRHHRVVGVRREHRVARRAVHREVQVPRRAPEAGHEVRGEEEQDLEEQN